MSLRTAATAVRALWDRITEPRHLKVLYAVIYAIAAATGGIALVWPPQSVEGALGDVLAAVWAILLLAGGVLGLVTVLPGWWALERLGIALVLCGIGIFAVVLAGARTNEPGAWAALLGFTVLSACTFVLRLISIRWYTFEPRR